MSIPEDNGVPAKSKPGLNRVDECVRHSEGRWTCWPSEAASAAQAPDTAVDRDLEIFRITTEHFRHDLTALWNHSSYFLLIQGALASVFANAIGPQDPDSKIVLVSARQEALILAVIGLVFALVWSWVAARRVALIQKWRENVTHLDGCVDRHGVYLRVEPEVGAHWWYGPSALTARLPWLVSGLWLIAIGALGWPSLPDFSL